MARFFALGLVLLSLVAADSSAQFRPRFGVGGRVGGAGFGSVYLGAGGRQVVLSQNVAPFGQAPVIVDVALPLNQGVSGQQGLRVNPFSVNADGKRVYVAAADVPTVAERLAKRTVKLREASKDKAHKYAALIESIEKTAAVVKAKDWKTVNEWFGDDVPVYPYNYGSRLTLGAEQLKEYGKDRVSLEKYGDAAIASAAKGKDAEAKGPWLELGVYAIGRRNANNPSAFMRLVVNKQGVLRGELLGFEDDQPKVHNLYGTVDLVYQRVCISFEAASEGALDNGLYDLVQPNSQALYHQGNSTSYLIIAKLDPEKIRKKD